MIRFLMYLLIASEFASMGSWAVWQYLFYQGRRKLDILLPFIYFALSLSYLLYGFEVFYYDVSNIAGYIVDAFIAIVLAIFMVRRLLLLFIRKEP